MLFRSVSQSRYCSAAGGVPGALVGGALGVASSLLGGPFGNHNTNKINQMNYRIMQEQNRFNAEEAKKNRDWQELMYSAGIVTGNLELISTTDEGNADRDSRKESLKNFIS